MLVTGTLTWLGGGHAADIAYRHERTGYAVTGATVAAFAVVAGLCVGSATAATESLPVLTTLVGAVLASAVAALLGRAIATARPGPGPNRPNRPDRPDRLGLLGRIALAVLLGTLLAELAATALFGATIDRVLDEKAQHAVDSAPAVVTANAELTAARDARAELAATIQAARTRLDTALVTARCEYNPSPECPQARITGDPGTGPEERTANDMLEDARTELAAQQDRVAGMDQRGAEAEKTVSAARSASFTQADRGFAARWRAMNDYTAHDTGALTLRVLVHIALIALALLPLVLRWWRGETSFDRHIAARGVLDRAEWETDTAIGLERATQRAEAERLRTEKQLAATRLAVEADTAIERERQRTRVIAAIGGLEIGVSESERPSASGTQLTKDGHMPTAESPSELPENATKSTELVPATLSKGLELPLLGTVPFTDTAARFIRPLIPGFVTDAIDTATHPLRTAWHAFEEVEEITFTVRRTRRVTVETSAAPTAHAAVPAQSSAERIAAVVDADYPKSSH